MDKGDRGLLIFCIICTLVGLGALIWRIAHNGIAWMSTIGYLG